MPRSPGPRRGRLLATVLTLALLPATTGTAAAAPTAAATPGPITAGTDQLAAELEPTAVAAVSSPGVVTLGQRAEVTGAVSTAPGRPVVLQMLTSGNGWQDVEQGWTDADGGFRLAAPAWLNRHVLRVVAPATEEALGGESPAVTVTVQPAYRPAGRSGDWSWAWPEAARWDPCRPITYRVRTAGGYAGSLRHVKRAFRTISQATGLQFAYRGRTRRIAIRQPNPRDIDVLVSWATPRQLPQLAGTTAGIGGSQRTGAALVRGMVVLDASERRLPRGFRAGRPSWGTVLVHEIAHVVGLGHARGRHQLMYGAATTRNTRFGAGDLTGLQAVGAAGGCLAPLESGGLRRGTKLRP